MRDLYELKEMAIEELKEYGRKGSLNPRDLPCIDTLAHTAKNLCKIIESLEEKTGYTYGSHARMRGNYSYGRSYPDNTYYGRRDSRGRYAGDDKWMVDTLDELIVNAPNDHMRMELEEFRNRVEQMK